MGIPKKAVKSQGEEATKKKATPIKVVKIEKEEIDPRPLKKGDTFLVVKGGRDVYYTRSTLDVLLQRNAESVVIPKGSGYIAPKGTKCDGCG